MTDIGQGRHRLAGYLHHDGLASIQIALRFIGVKVGEADRVNVQEEDPADKSAGLWEDIRVP
jgi:hypothetical protein